ncbi:hypothetical protein [Moorena sp. SIO3H5]|nr:hypothetical protein [Moorena sp. SIO3H5]
MQHNIVRGLDPGNNQSGIRQPLPIKPDPKCKRDKKFVAAIQENWDELGV